ncbi:MAG: CvpA family protein [Clostridia bacterium]|nr:CvpA family protein [Clostridia bacterium]
MGHMIADVIFLLVGIALIFACAKRGFLKSVVHFLKTILALVAAYFFGTKLGAFLCDKFIGGAVRDFVYDKLHTMYKNAAENFNAESIFTELPAFLKTEEIKAGITAAEGSGEQLVTSVTDSIASPIATVISNIFGYIGVFLITLVVLWIGAILLDKLIDHIGILDRLNTVLGAVLGFLIAIVLLFVAASVIKFFWAESAIYADSVIVKFFGESSLLEKIKFLDVRAGWFGK